jgi:ABC-2 type transport system permease protein
MLSFAPWAWALRARTSIGCDHLMNQARAILWAQWRSQRNFFPRRGIGWTAMVGLIWYGFWIAAAFAVMLLTSSPLSTSLSGVFLLVFLYWQVVPVLMAASGASLDLRKLQAYPIPVSQLFWLEAMLRITVAIEVVLILTGAGIGIVRNPTLHAWHALGLLPFAAFNLVLGVGTRDTIARVLARRRIREAAFFLLILCAALPQIVFTRGRVSADRLRALMARMSWAGWPWTATADFLQGHAQLRALAILAAWLAAAGLFSYWQFRRTMLFDVDAASARASGRSALSQFVEEFIERFFRLPSLLLGDPLGALVEKDVRFLTRSPRFRLVFLMGFTFGLLIWLPMALGRQGTSQSFLGSNYLTVVSMYSLILLSEACFWNFFGFDRSAAQLYFLAPVAFSRVMIGKNLSALFFIVLEIGMITLVCGLLGMPLHPRTLAESFSVAAVISVFMLAAGNQLSLRQPRPMNPAASFRSGASGRVQAILFVIWPIAFVPVGLAYLARYAFDSEAAFFGVLAVDAAIGAIVYKLSLDSAVAVAEQLKEQIVTALSRGEGPITA